MGEFVLAAKAFAAAHATQIAIASAVASTGASVAATRQAAGAQQVEMEMAKREEASAARDREVQRQRRLNAILGAQAADAAAKGIQMTGSVANISIEDAKRAREDSQIDQQNTRSRVSALGRRSRSIDRVAKIKNAATIFRAGERIVSRG